MNYLNNFYFKMLVKSAKMTNNLNQRRKFKEIIKYFQTDSPEILPHVWLDTHDKWDSVYTMLIEKRFINDTIKLVKNIRNINLNPNDIKRAFDEHTVFGSIFYPNRIFDERFNEFYYK
jgi:hypothetical protein